MDGKDVGTMLFPVMQSGHGYTRSTHMTLQLTEGEHTIRIAYATDNWYDENMNYMQGSMPRLSISTISSWTWQRAPQSPRCPP